MPIERFSSGADVSPATGAYSLVSVAPPNHRLGVVSGQTGRRRDGTISGDPGEQTLDALRNVAAVLKSAGARPSDLLLLRWLVVGTERVDAVRLARDGALATLLGGDEPPASTLAVVAGLAGPGALVEVEAWFATTDHLTPR